MQRETPRDKLPHLTLGKKIQPSADLLKKNHPHSHLQEKNNPAKECLGAVHLNSGGMLFVSRQTILLKNFEKQAIFWRMAPTNFSYAISGIRNGGILVRQTIFFPPSWKQTIFFCKNRKQTICFKNKHCPPPEIKWSAG